MVYGNRLPRRTPTESNSELVGNKDELQQRNDSNIPKSHGDTMDDTLELRILALAKENLRISQREFSEQLSIFL